MASNQVITNKLLAFLQSQLGINKESSIQRICKMNFTEEEISSAKTLLCKTLNINEQISQLKTEKQEENLEEIVRLLKETDPDQVPTFVAKYCRMPIYKSDDVVSELIQNLTVVETNTFVMQKKLTMLQSTLNELIKEGTAVRGIISAQIPNLNMPRRPTHSPISTDSAVSDWSSATDFASDVESYPSLPLSPLGETSSNASTASDTASVISTSTLSNVTTNSNTKAERSLENQKLIKNTQKLQNTTKPQEVLKQCPTKVSEGDGFIKVERRRKSSESSNKFKPRWVPRPWTTLLVTPMPFVRKAEEVVDYIQYKTQLILRVEKVDWRPEDQEKVRFSSFTVNAPTDKLKIFMEKGFWPKGAVCRRLSDVLREAKEKRMGIGKDDVMNQEPKLNTGKLPSNEPTTIDRTHAIGQTTSKTIGTKAPIQVTIKSTADLSKPSSQVISKSTSTEFRDSSQSTKRISGRSEYSITNPTALYGRKRQGHK